MKNRIAALLAALALAGCSSHPITIEEATDTPPLHVFHPSSLEPTPGFAEVTFLRDRNLVDTSLYYLIFIDGERFAAIDSGEKLTVWLPPRTFTLAINATPNWQRGLTAASYITKFVLDAKADQRYTVRIGYDQGDRFVFAARPWNSAAAAAGQEGK